MSRRPRRKQNLENEAKGSSGERSNEENEDPNVEPIAERIDASAPNRLEEVSPPRNRNLEAVPQEAVAEPDEELPEEELPEEEFPEEEEDDENLKISTKICDTLKDVKVFEKFKRKNNRTVPASQNTYAKGHRRGISDAIRLGLAKLINFPKSFIKIKVRVLPVGDPLS